MLLAPLWTERFVNTVYGVARGLDIVDQCDPNKAPPRVAAIGVGLGEIFAGQNADARFLPQVLSRCRAVADVEPEVERPTRSSRAKCATEYLQRHIEFFAVQRAALFDMIFVAPQRLRRVHHRQRQLRTAILAQAQQQRDEIRVTGDEAGAQAGHVRTFA